MWHSQYKRIDSSPIAGLSINAGVVFEVDAVLPWDDEKDKTGKRYRIELNRHVLDQMADEENTVSEREFKSLNLVLGEEDQPIVVYADESDLELVAAFDGGIPGKITIPVWNQSEQFPWTIVLTFAAQGDFLRYRIESWLVDDGDDDDPVVRYMLDIFPLYAKPNDEPLLTLTVSPGDYDEWERPVVAFSAKRGAAFRLDSTQEMMFVDLGFQIIVDLDQGKWEFSEPT